ncbi:MAG: hypothetical protein AB7P04_00925 [Bacteriovoracia bacterium]
MKITSTLVMGLLLMGANALAEARFGSTALERQLDRCDRVVENQTDYVLCPRADTLVFSTLFELNRHIAMISRYNSSFKASSEAEGVALILGSFRAQIQALPSVVVGPGSPQFFARMHRQANRIEKLLRREAAGKTIYIDTDGYWGPSVNARLMHIVDTEKLTITSVLHGDTDG